MATPTPNLAARTATGVLWMTGQTIASRVLSLVSQWALAWLLMPEHFGKIALVTTITSCGTQLTNPGIDDVLLQKQRHIAKWVTPAFWLSLICGIGGAGLMAVLGIAVVTAARHFGNSAYGDITVLWMTLILAIGAPVNAAALVPTVMLRSEMRFARLAAINFCEIIFQQGLIVACAALGFGAYSFVLPLPIVAVVRAIVLWWMVRPPVRLQLATHRWPALTTSTGWVFGGRLLSTLTGQGDYMTLGVLLGEDAVVGTYYFAYVLSVQIMRMVADNVHAVLLPALNTINEDDTRLRHAGERASRLLAAMIVPLATLQILLAGRVIPMLFAPKWAPAIPLLQLLSAGPLLYAPAWPLYAMITASGRFRAAFIAWAINTVAFFAIVIAMTWRWRAPGTAAAVSVWSWFAVLCLSVVAHRSIWGVAHVFRAVSRPLAAATGAAVAGALIVWWMPHGRLLDALTILVVTPAVLGIYVTLLRRLDREAVDLLLGHLGSAVGSLIGRLPSLIGFRPN